MAQVTMVGSRAFFAGPQRNTTATPFVGPVQARAVAPMDHVALSEEALPAGTQNLMQFGGDRKHALETLVASGAKAENPKLHWYEDALRLFAGGKTRTTSKPISATQTVNTKVKVKNFHLKKLRLTTLDHQHGRTKVFRHIDFGTQTPTGKDGEVKDIGQIVAAGKVKRMFEQTVRKPVAGDPGTIHNEYFDPKTGNKFLDTNEISHKQEIDKNGTYKSRRSNDSYREINLLDSSGKVTQRYVFDYANKDVRLENLNSRGKVSSSEEISKKTNYWDLVNELSLQKAS